MCVCQLGRALLRRLSELYGGRVSRIERLSEPRLSEPSECERLNEPYEEPSKQG